LAVASVVVFAATSCAKQNEQFDLVESDLIEGAWANPVDRVLYPDESAAAMIHAAGEASIAACMAERGFDYEGGAFPEFFPREQAQYFYGVTDPASAETNGLRSTIWMASVLQSQDESSSPSDDYLAALNGRTPRDVRDSTGVVVGASDPDSCLGMALDSVTPNWADLQGLQYQAGVALLLSDVKSRRPVRNGFADWSECMAQSGHDYPGPWLMAYDFLGDSPTEAEKALAVTSANCMHSSGLLRAWSKAQAEATWDELQRSYPDLLSRWDVLFAETVEYVEGL
jgi:hypothetical protein